MIHESRPPQVAEILKILNQHRVQFVITGSVAAQLYGVDLEPADLDVVPATDRGNLERLVPVLQILEARPPGPFGSWETLPNGEWKWTARPTTQEEVLAWAPDVGDPMSFDNLYRSRLGDFDVVPHVSGSYELLMRRAIQIPGYGCNPWVAHVDEILARLTIPRREKDVTKVAKLRELQRQRGETEEG